MTAWRLAAFRNFCRLVAGTVVLSACTSAVPLRQRTAGAGVVVQSVTKGSPFELAGIVEGDLLLGWERSIAEAEAGRVRGDFTSPFDVEDVAIEQAPRGGMRIELRRGETRLTLPIAAGVWPDRVRPVLPPQHLTLYEEAERKRAGKDPAAAAALLRTLHAGLETDREKQLWVTVELAATLVAAGDVEAASAEYVRAADAALAVGKLSAAAQILIARGQLLEKANDYDGAEKALVAAVELRRRLAPRSLATSSALHRFGFLLQNQGQLQRANEVYLEALALRKEFAPQAIEVAMTTNNLGSVAYDRGDLEAAAAYYAEALAMKERLAPDSLTLAFTLNGLGLVASQRGDLAGGENYHRRALEIRERLSPESLVVAMSLNNLGSVARRRGDLATAEEKWKRSLALREKLVPGSLSLANALQNLGVLALEQKDPATAEKRYREALAIRQKLAPDSPDIADILTGIAETHFDRGDLAAAEKLYRESYAFQERVVPAGLNNAANLLALGRIVFLRGDLVSAKDFYERALALDSRFGSVAKSIAESYYGLSTVSRREGSLREAAGHLRRSIEALEAQKASLGGTQDVQSGFTASYADYYREYIDLLIELGEREKAFHILERSRARGLLAMLTERDLVFTADVPEPLERERKLLEHQYDETQAKLANWKPAAGGVADLETLLERLRTLRIRQEEISTEIRKASPRYGSLRYPEPLDLAGARKLLDPGTLLLSFSVGKERTHLFAVTNDEAARISTTAIAAGDASLRRMVGAFRTLIERGKHDRTPSASLRKSASELYELLFAPVASKISSASRVLISADGPLHVLPFAALVADRPSSAASEGAEFLVLTKPIHTIVSATLYGQLRRTRTPTAGPPSPAARLVAFGDPLYPTASAAGDDSSASVRSVLPRGYELMSLPATRLEVDAIAALYGASSEKYLGEKASEERVKALGVGIRYLHFACHGFTDERFPLSSGLILSLPEQGGTVRENGVLQAWEIFERLRIDADLVTLSACETGLGKEVAGEGLIGLTRAFQYAGAKSIVASLWSVSDASTAELMKHFYGYLRDGRTKDVALQLAQRKLFGSIDTSHPFHWAAFQLLGDWR